MIRSLRLIGLILLSALASGGVAHAQEQDEAGAIYLVEGRAELFEQSDSDAPLDPQAEICLDPSERAILASERVTFTLEGAQCQNLAAAERLAFEQEQLLSDQFVATSVPDAPPVRAPSVVMRATGPSAIRFPVGQRIGATRPVCLEAEDTVTVVDEDGTFTLRGPGCSYAARTTPSTTKAFIASTSTRRVRTGAVRGSGSGPSSKPVVFRVSGGTEAVLARFPRGSVVQRRANICLAEGQQLSIAGSNGQRVTYRGPGCMKRNARPTRDNLGGFTFG